MSFVQQDLGRLSVGPVGELVNWVLVSTCTNNVPTGAWHYVTSVERTSRRDPQHQITVVHVVVGGTCREVLTGFLDKSDSPF